MSSPSTRENVLNAPVDEPEKLQIHQRIRKYAEAHPKETVFFLENEDEVAELLLAIAATIHLSVKSMAKGVQKSSMKMVANNCRAAVKKGGAYEFFKVLSGADYELEMFGLRIKTSYTPASSSSAVKGGS